jgi:magnesium transporter
MRIWSYLDGRWRETETETPAPRWYDLAREDAAFLKTLGERFGLHPLAIDDCLSPYIHTPKIDDFGEYMFVVVAAMVPGSTQPEPEELDLFLSADYLITYHDGPEAPPSIAEVANAISQGVSVRPGVDGLMYEIIDRSVDAIIPRVSAMSEELDAIEDRIVVEGVSGGDHHRVLELRSVAGRIRRIIVPEQNLMLRFGRGEFHLVQPSNQVYYRDIYDHLVRVDMALEGLREDAEVALGTYMSALNNRMNEVMKVLAVVGALALPATVITGIFGTNFDDIPGLHSNWGFATMMAAMAGIAGGMAYMFHRRGWF